MQKIPLILFVFFALALAACRSNLPEKSSANYAEAVKSFYVGLAAMQAADDQRAKAELNKTVNLAADEPAAWANLGILQMRQKDFEASAASLEKARNLAPENAQIYTNIAVLEIQRGNFEKAKQNFQKAAELAPGDSKALYALAREYERTNEDALAAAEYEKILQAKPDNLPALLEVVRLAAKRGDTEKVKSFFKRIAPRLENWDDEIKKQFGALESSAENPREVSRNVGFFRNVLLRLPEFRSEIADIKYDDTVIGEPFVRPLKLPAPDFAPAEPDLALTFSPQTIENVKANFARAIFLNGDSAPVVAWSNEKETRVGKASLPVSASNSNQIAEIDLDYNFKNDIAFATDKGFRLFRQTDGGNFDEVTAQTNIPKETLQKSYTGIWTFDVEIDGDLDLILASREGAPVVLQNNADGSFKEIKIFAEISELRDFVFADFDEDGDADAAAINSDDKIQYFSNERGALFKERTLPISAKVWAIAVADVNGDGKIDLVVSTENENVSRITDKNNGREFEIAELFKGDLCNERRGLFPGICRIKAADLDNNGATDILEVLEVTFRSARIAFAGKDASFVPSDTIAGEISSFADLNNDGKLDLIGLDADGKPTVFLNKSAKNYGWQTIRPRSAHATGDQRVNSFGIGGEMEIRSGLLAQKRLISSPQVHFGLGEQASTDLLRIIWGNGFVQVEFDLAKDEQILVQQRLTGSCPHLFAWNGSEFKLVKDSAPLGTSLGLKISDKDVLPVTKTEEWYKIPGEALAPRDDFYELRITDELWETYYADSYSLMAIDHPDDTEIFANELYPIPPDLRIFTTSTPKSFARATDEKGNDVSKMVENTDEIYLDTFEKARFQGVAKEHFVELELPADAPNDEQIYVIADGWLHPTDTSLNVAISQSSYEKPKGLSLDILDENGAWKTVKDDFGVPAGKMKTVLVELPKGAKRVRLRTNSEIFWDKLAWASGASDSKNETRRLDFSNAELKFRGFSVIEKRDASSPEIPDYNRIATTTPRWRDIEGYYTRYGEILELLLSADDRYAIVAAGDEMVLRFTALPPPRAGYKRDFVIVGNGWIKEGDYNNVFSKTVLPLPTHATNDYTRPPTRLEDDPVYRKNKADWLNFHTRYVVPDLFRNALRVK